MGYRERIHPFMHRHVCHVYRCGVRSKYGLASRGSAASMGWFHEVSRKRIADTVVYVNIIQIQLYTVVCV